MASQYIVVVGCGRLGSILASRLKRMLQPKNTVTEPNYWQGDRRSFLNDSQIRIINFSC